MLSEMELERRRREELRERRRRAARKKKIRAWITRLLTLTGMVLLTVGAMVILKNVKEAREAGSLPIQKIVEDPPDYMVDLLEINDYSRPGTTIGEIHSIVIHYTANPGTTAKQNRDYFNGLKDSKKTKASSHFVIGLEGEILQCIPCNEMAYASNDRNIDSISIECCHADETGEFNKATKDTLVRLTAWLIGRYGLTTDDVIRHYDVTGKQCPLYYVEHEDAWEQFKKDVNRYIITYGIPVK